MKCWPLGLRVGILGGGQLARMLAHSAQRMGLEVHVLCPNPAEPGAQVTGYHHAGSANSAADLVKFLKSVDVVTFESEFFDMDLIEKKTPKDVAIFPKPQIMRTLQDRRTQKAWLQESKIPTAPFTIVETATDLEKAWQALPGGFVLKKARGGYDGYGTFYAREKNDLEALARNFPGPCIAEQLIRFRRELASVAVCGEQDVVFLPLVESKQTQSRCDWVLGPVQHRAWDRLQVQLRKQLRRLGYRGVIAFEFFDTGSNLLVNEVAPRVHNSAHYSMQALEHSQFDLHWEAGLGLQIAEPRLLAKGFAMTNLIGESDQPFEFPTKLAGSLHWYGKKSNRPGRKMGHLNYTGPKTSELLRSALRERKRIQK